ncbi:MAG: DEAD/DEAH box helicase family protein [Planctomycetes bacterium]|nr:DEAD/DEAH box helicase family protein [Planctomycetota bacterium]MBL7040152.1 DEAD/DEAH box helicase family protein [Pirellulaceae bacterium]
MARSNETSNKKCQRSYTASAVDTVGFALLAGTTVEPRPYQARIVSNAIAMYRGTWSNRAGELEPPAHSVLVESPTGSGKTIIALAIARQMQQEFGFTIGWVAMRRNLLAQARSENRRWGFDVDMHTISMFEKNPPAVDMLIVDEAQHDAAMSMANLHCEIRPKKILGLTATPFRTDRIKLCFDKVIRDAGIHQLIQDGYLSRYHHYTIPEYTPASVARFLIDDPDHWGKSLVFFHRQDQCDECCRILTSRDIRAEVVTAKTDRERQITDFTEGRIDVLINMLILTEGFDCPSLKTVFCRPSGRGCTIQMGGRVFRKHPGIPYKQIAQCKNTRHPFVKTAMADEQYVWSDGQWRSLSLNRHISAISDRARQVIARAQVQLPQLVAAHRTSPLPWEREM